MPMFASPVHFAPHSYASPLVQPPEPSNLLPSLLSISAFEQPPAAIDCPPSQSIPLSPLPFLLSTVSTSDETPPLVGSSTEPTASAALSSLDAETEAHSGRLQEANGSAGQNKPALVALMESTQLSDESVSVSSVSSSVSSHSSSPALPSSAVTVSNDAHPPPLRRKRGRPLRQRCISQSAHSNHAANSDSGREYSSDEEQHRKHRAAVLEATVHTAQRMYHQLTTLSTACEQQHDSIQQLRRQLKAVTAALHVATRPRRCYKCEHPLTALPGDESSILQSCLTSSVLASSLLLTCRVGVSVMDGTSGQLLDANDELLHFSGWQRSQLIDACQPVVGWTNVRSQAQLRRAVDDKSADNNTGRIGLAADQYGRSWSRLWQLYSGELDKTDAMWRCCHAPGEKYEMKCSTHVASWTDEWEDRVGHMGGMRRVPGRVVWIISITDAKRVD